MERRRARRREYFLFHLSSPDGDSRFGRMWKSGRRRNFLFALVKSDREGGGREVKEEADDEGREEEEEGDGGGEDIDRFYS